LGEGDLGSCGTMHVFIGLRVGWEEKEYGNCSIPKMGEKNEEM
jgi:hypothetical protein